MIYIVQILDAHYIKVGYSAGADVSVRIAQLQTGCPFEILPLLSVEGSLKQEQSLHDALGRAFARIRIPIPANEWYPGRNPFCQQFVQKMVGGFPAGFSFASGFDQSVKQGGEGRADCSKPTIRWPTKMPRGGNHPAHILGAGTEFVRPAAGGRGNIARSQ